MTIRVGFLRAGFITNIHTWFLGDGGVDHVIAAVHDPVEERAAMFAVAHRSVDVGSVLVSDAEVTVAP